jgi:autotransporter-associated beta strand protein
MKFSHDPVQSSRIHRSNGRRYCTRVCSILATNIAVLLALHTMNAATYYWDTNGATPGSGAATANWDGSTANWTTDSTGSIVPAVTLTTSADDLIFSAGTNGTAGTVTVSGAQAANSITFDDNVAVTLSGGTSITLGGGGGSNSGITVASGDNAANNISTPIILGASTSTFAFTNSGAGLLTVGAITGSATSGMQTLTLSSTSNGGITLNGIIGDGAAGGKVALVINNSGSGVTTLTGANTFSGGLTISQGTLSVGDLRSNQHLGASGAAVSLNGGTLQYTGATAATLGTDTSHPITVGPSGGTILMTGNATTSQNSRIILNTTANLLTGSGALTITGAAGHTLGGTGAAGTKDGGAGALVLGIANNYAGAITLQNGGLLEYGIAGALGAGATINVGNEGEMFVGGATVPNNVTISGGTNSVVGFNGNNILSGTLTLNANAVIGLRSWFNYGAVQSGQISGQITGTGSLTVNSGTTSGGVLTLNTTANNNNYSGGTSITSSTVTAQDTATNNFDKALGTGTVTLNTGSVLNLRANGSGATQTIITGDGTTGNNVTVAANTTIDVNRVSANTGSTFQFNTLSIGANTLNVTGGNTYGLKFAGATTLTGNATFNPTTAPLTLGAIGDSNSGFSLTKLGAGNLNIIGTSTYTGATTAYAGTIALSTTAGKLATSGIVLNNATFSEDNSGTNYVSTARLTNGTAPGLTLQNGSKVTITGNTVTAGNNTTETVGALTLDNSQSTFTLNASTSNSVLLTTSSLVRNNNATALILGTSLGQGAVGTNTALLRVTSNPTGSLIGGSGTYTSGTATNIAILPYLVGDVSPAGTGTSLVGYDTTNNSLRVLKTTEFNTFAGTTADLTTAAATDNVRLSSANTAIAVTGSTINSLILDEANAAATVTYTLTGAVAPTSGAVLFSKSVGTARTAILTGGTLAFGAQEGVLTNTATQSLTLTSAVTGSAGLTISAGTGGVTLNSSSNAITGGLNVNGGTVTAGVSSALNGSTGTALNIYSGTFAAGATTQAVTSLKLLNNATVSGAGGTLNLGGDVTYDATGNFTTGGTISVTNLNLNGSRIFNVGDSTNTATDLTVSSAMADGTGTGALTKSGAGTMVLSTSGTYSGPTVVNGGALNLNAAITAANSDITVNRGGNFNFTGNAGTTVTYTVAKSLTLNGGTTTDFAVFRNGVTQFATDLTLASGDSTLSVNGLQNGGTFGSNLNFLGALNRSSTSAATALFRGISLGAGINNSANIRFTGTTPTLTGGGGAIGTTTTSILPYAIGDNGELQGTYYVTSGLGTDFVTYGANGVQLLTTYASTITSGASALNNVKVTDTSATGINAATTINSLILNSVAAAAGSPGTSSVDGTGTLTLNSGALMVTTTSAAAGNGGTAGNYGGLFQNNATIGASGLTLGFGSAEAIVTTVGTSTLTLASTGGGITGTGGLTKSGAGTLKLNAADTLSGVTTINAGSIVLGNANALQNSTLNYNNQGGTLSFGTLTSVTLGGLKGAQNIALTNTAAAAVALTVGSAGDSDSTTYSGVLSGSGSLTKAGSGTMTLAGASTYTGSTAVNGGELIVSGSLNGTLNVNVASSATLASGATGSIATAASGDVSISGTLAPGDFGTVGTLTLAPGSGGKLNFLSGSTFNFTISGATSDQVSFSTTDDWLSGSGNVTLSLTGITGSDYGNAYTVFHNVSTTGFALAGITGYDTANYVASFTQVGSDYQLSFTAIPEPGMPISLLGGAGVLFVVRRRRGRARA